MPSRAAMEAFNGAGAPPGVEAADIIIEPEAVEIAPDVLMLEGDDGGSNIVFGPSVPEMADLPEPDHDANLALYLDDSELDNIASELLTAVDKDESSSKEYRQVVENGMKWLGLRYEEVAWPFNGACGAYDSLLMEAIVRYQATAHAELLPARGPVLTQILGTAGAMADDQATRVKQFFNYYLTEAAPEYYPDSDRMFFAQGCWGSVFRKVYYDPRLGRPTARFLTPREFIVSYTTRDLASCPRSCELIYMTQKEMRQLQITGFYRDIDLGQPDEEATETDTTTEKSGDGLIGIRLEMAEGDDRHIVREIHVDYDLSGFEHQLQDEGGAETGPSGMPLPYIISIDSSSRKVLSIRRNWKEGDPLYRHIKWYVHHQMVPGDGFYGYGYIHMLGGAARASTMMLRQNVDAGTLSLFPGGMRIKGLRVENSEVMIGPCQFIEVETGGLPIDQAIQPMPYKGPSEVSMNLRQMVRDEAKGLAATTEIAVGDGRQDAPVGTTLALMEGATKVQNAVLKRERVAFKEEFEIFERLFCEWLPNTPYPFPVRGGGQPGQQQVIGQDFCNGAAIVPVSDPNASTTAQRQLRDEATMRLAGSMPGVFDQRTLAAKILIDWGYDQGDIEAMMPDKTKVPPRDPVSENQIAMTGGPLASAPWQDHTSHIIVHAAAIQAMGMLAHIQEHFAQKFRIDIQNALGQQLPPLGQPLPPPIENEIAMLSAKAVEVMKVQAQQQGGQQLDPVQVALEQVKVDATKIQAKLQEAEMKDRTERYKANLEYQARVADIQTQRSTARLRAFVDLSDNIRPVEGGAGQVWER